MGSSILYSSLYTSNPIKEQWSHFQYMHNIASGVRICTHLPPKRILGSQYKEKQERLLGEQKTPPPTNYLLWHPDWGDNKWWQIYVYHRSLLSLKIWVTLTLTYQGHTGSNVMVSLDSLLMVNSNLWPNSAPLRDERLQNLGELDFDLSRSPKVKCDGAFGLPIYGFLLIFNSNIGPN